MIDRIDMGVRVAGQKATMDDEAVLKGQLEGTALINISQVDETKNIKVDIITPNDETKYLAGDGQWVAFPDFPQSDELVKISSTDATAGYLADKLTSTDGSVTITDEGSTLDLSATGGGGGAETVNIETLTADKTLTASDATIQILQTGSANRIVNLPTTGLTIGQKFVIWNNNEYSNNFYIDVIYTITKDKIYSQKKTEFYWDGTNWFYTNEKNVAIGDRAEGYNYGAALGYQADGHSSGAALGYAAVGYNLGVAIGYGANGSDAGAALGYSAHGSNMGAALGYGANAINYGAAVGSSANGINNGAAVGRNAVGNSFGAALGHVANGSVYGAALGYGANGSSYGSAVGRGASGSDNGAAMGYVATGNGYGAAMGNNAIGNGYGAALGYIANGSDGGAAVGRGAVGYNYGVAAGYLAAGYICGAALGYRAVGDNYGAALGYIASTNSKQMGTVALGTYSQAERNREIVSTASSDTNNKAQMTIQKYKEKDILNNVSTWVELFVDASSSRLVLLSNSVYNFFGELNCYRIATNDGVLYPLGAVKGWQFTGLIKNVAGVVALVGVPTITLLGCDTDVDISNVDMRIEADDTNNSLKLSVYIPLGTGGQIYRFSGNIFASETRM